MSSKKFKGFEKAGTCCKKVNFHSELKHPHVDLNKNIWLIAAHLLQHLLPDLPPQDDDYDGQ